VTYVGEAAAIAANKYCRKVGLFAALGCEPFYLFWYFGLLVF